MDNHDLIDPALRPTFDPPPVAAANDEDAPPPETVAPTTSKPSTTRLRVIATVAAVAVAAVGVLAVLHNSAATERDKNGRELAETEADLATSVSDLTDTKARLATTQTDLADTRAKLAGTTAMLTASDGLAAQYRDASAAFLAASMELGLGISTDDATCMGDALIAKLGPEALTLLAGADKSLTAARFGVEAMSVAGDCGVPLSAFDPGGSARGDDPTLDALYDQCATGDGGSCDALYEESAYGSEYELFGLTCGGRFVPADAPFSCANI